jgi:lipoprotein-anchoring transpeptidase ErfK/SrfK
MRAIGVGLALFLVVTTLLLRQVSSDGSAPAVALTEPTQTSMTAQSHSTPTRTSDPTSAPATATRPAFAPTATATVAPPIEPTSEPEPVIETTEASQSIEPDALTVESETDDGAEAVVEPEVETDAIGSDVSLAAVDAIEDGFVVQTPNGGVIGVVASGLANIRAAPSVDGEILSEVHGGWPVAIYGAVAGAPDSGSEVWYQLGDGGYVAGELIQPFVPSAPATYHAGHWVDVDLTRNVAVAYVDDVPVNAVVIISGKPGFETPVGDHTVFSRVENETLDSATVGIGMDDPEYYYLPDVPYTQYFATGGFAIHANYWSDPWEFGTATSHGCVNMFEEDAAWFWWFLDIGSVVSVHY